MTDDQRKMVHEVLRQIGKNMIERFGFDDVVLIAVKSGDPVDIFENSTFDDPEDRVTLYETLLGMHKSGAMEENFNGTKH